MAHKLKEKCDRVGRLRVAELMGIPYTTLSNKLNGYSGWNPKEMDRLTRILSALESKEQSTKKATQKAAV